MSGRRPTCKENIVPIQKAKLVLSENIEIALKFFGVNDGRDSSSFLLFGFELKDFRQCVLQALASSQLLVLTSSGVVP
jgi:hypothetical protein